jgi:hypothetical protein
MLQSLVAAHAVTTPEDMWVDGLRVQAPRAKRGRTKPDEEDGEDAPPTCLSVPSPAPEARMTTTDCMMDRVQILSPQAIII